MQTQQIALIAVLLIVVIAVTFLILNKNKLSNRQSLCSTNILVNTATQQLKTQVNPEVIASTTGQNPFVALSVNDTSETYPIQNVVFGQKANIQDPVFTYRPFLTQFGYAQTCAGVSLNNLPISTNVLVALLQFFKADKGSVYNFMDNRTQKVITTLILN